jgi:hypothetical protein
VSLALVLTLQFCLAEVFLLVPARLPATDHYSVEVSGWDISEGFFVEKCELEWNEQSGKCVALRRMLSEGAHVFVRLLQPMSAERSSSVAYEAHFAGARPDGHCQFRLVAVCPRLNEAGSAQA